jgi:hypothetical protein
VRIRQWSPSTGSNARRTRRHRSRSRHAILPADRTRNLLFKAPPTARPPWSAIGQDALWSESFAARHALTASGSVRLPTSSAAAVSCCAIYYDYSSDRGVVVMDQATFTRHFGEQRPSSLSVYRRRGPIRPRRTDLLPRHGRYGCSFTRTPRFRPGPRTSTAHLRSPTLWNRSR